MSDDRTKDESTDDSEQTSEPQTTDTDQPTAQSDEQPTDQTDQPTEQSEAQAAQGDQAAGQTGDHPTDSNQTADQSEEQSAEGDQSAATAEEQPADSDQPATAESGTDTVALADEQSSPAGAGGGVLARPSPKPKRSPPPTLVNRRFVFRFAADRGSVDSTPAALVDMANNALAGGLLSFRIEEVVAGKTLLVGREGGAKIPRPTLPPPSNVNTDDPGDLVYHFKSVGMDLSISLWVTPPIVGNDPFGSDQREKVITRTDWFDSTETGLPEPTLFVKGSVNAIYSLVPVSDGETLDSALKARNISRKDIFYLSSQPRPRNDAVHTMDYDVVEWSFLSVDGQRLTPK
jgi:hypothetical protein